MIPSINSPVFNYIRLSQLSYMYMYMQLKCLCACLEHGQIVLFVLNGGMSFVMPFKECVRVLS